MKKFSKIGKRVLAFFLVALMNINVYATSVSNDGSAFVTKAEFDDLVQEFNKQMDSYQAGLNAKIDYAVANYISGLSTVSKLPQENIHDAAEKMCKNNTLYFAPLLNIKDTNEADIMVQHGEVLFANTGSQYVWRYRVYGQDTNQTYWKDGDTKGKYYYLTSNKSLLAYWTDSYIEHNFAGSASNSYNPNQNRTVTVPKMTYLKNRTKVGPFSESYTASDNTGKSWGNNISCNLSLTKTVDTKYENNVMYDEVEVKDSVWCIYDSEIDDIEQVKQVDSPVWDQIVNISGSSYTTEWAANHPTRAYAYKYKSKGHKINSTEITNAPVSAAFGSPVALYEGVPFVKCSHDGDLIFDMTWTVNGGDVTQTRYTEFGFRKSGFSNSQSITTDPNIKTNLDTNLAESGKSINVKIEGVKKDEVYWIKGIPVTGNTSNLKIKNMIVQY